MRLLQGSFLPSLGEVTLAWSVLNFLWSLLFKSSSSVWRLWLQFFWLAAPCLDLCGELLLMVVFFVVGQLLYSSFLIGAFFDFWPFIYIWTSSTPSLLNMASSYSLLFVGAIVLLWLIFSLMPNVLCIVGEWILYGQSHHQIDYTKSIFIRGNI